MATELALKIKYISKENEEEKCNDEGKFSTKKAIIFHTLQNAKKKNNENRT